MRTRKEHLRSADEFRQRAETAPKEKNDRLLQIAKYNQQMANAQERGLLPAGSATVAPKRAISRTDANTNFDPETYLQARPHFIKAASKFGAFLNDINDLVRQMVREFREAYGWTEEMVKNFKPYFRKFIEEVQAGDITREELAGEKITS